MKKFLFLLSFLAVFAFESKAQTASVFPTVFGDTVITSASLDSVSKVISVTAGYSTLGIGVNATKVSGTITAKAYLYSSMDGTNYVLTDSASAAFANVAGTQTALFNKIQPPYVYYKVMVRNVGTTGSTESLAVKVYYVERRFDHPR